MFRKKDHTKEILAVLVVILIGTLVVNIYLLWNFSSGLLEIKPETPAPFGGVVTPPSVEGYTLVDISTSANTILLTSGCSELSMVTTQQQVSSIQNGLEGKVNLRPSTHDIFADTLENYGIGVMMAKVDNLKENTYYANLVLTRDDRVLILDSKPSDAIAVAVRFGAPIYLENSLLKEYGRDIC